MHNWNEKIDELTQKFEENFSPLSHEDLNWKLNSNTWSIAQVINHLLKVNESYFTVFEKLGSGKYKLPFIAKIDFLVSFFGNSIKRSVEPKTAKKMKTFGLWEPQQTEFSDKTLDEFILSQKKLKGYIAASEDYIENNQVISSPVNRNIVYKLETAFDIIVMHQERHLNQAMAILEEKRKLA